MLRFVVERVRDGRFLDLDFPLAEDSVSTALSGPGGLAGTVAPDVGGMRDSGELIVEPYATLIHREEDGVIRGSYIVTRCEYVGDEWQIDGQGFSSYLDGLTYDGSREWVNADPIAIIRHIWEHAQTRTGGDLGVTVVGSSPARIGEPKRDVNFKTGAGDDVSFEAGPFTLHWWDTPDLGREVEGLAAAAGYEFYEWSAWNKDKTAIRKELRYVPRVGRRKPEARFVEGENIIDKVPLVNDGTDYANHVVAIGAGEGKKALRVSLAKSDSRLRRDLVLDLKNVRSKKVLEAEARAALDVASRKYSVQGVQIVDHPNAEFGVFQAGDEVLIEADFEWVGRMKLWHRITEVEWGDGTAFLALEVV